MINEILTWLKSNKVQREVISSVKNGGAYIVTEYYMYNISRISLKGDCYVFELSNKLSLGYTSERFGPTEEDYEKSYRPETNMYFSSDDFTTLTEDFSEWNRIDNRVALYYDKFVKSYKK